MDEQQQADLTELTSSVVSAYVSNNPVPPADLPNLIFQVSATLARLAEIAPSEPEKERLKPAVSIKKSITDDYLISLEDGKRYKSLKRHLATHGLTPDEYRQKWRLPANYPMVSAAYSAQRSALAKSLGLGRKPVTKKAPDKRRSRKTKG